MKYFFSLFLIAGCSLVSCTSGSGTETVKAPKKDTLRFSQNIFLPLYIGKILEAPFEYGPILNDSVCKQYAFSKINMYSKNGRLKNNISEKHTYLFNSDGLPEHYFHFNQISREQPYTELLFGYNAGKQVTKIEFAKFISFSNTPPVTITYDSLKTINKISRGGEFYDSILFYPSLQQPSLIAQVGNQQVKWIEFIVDVNDQQDKWKELITLLDSNYRDLNLSNKSVTLLENGLPQESYSLNNEMEKMERQKVWEYNKDNKPVNYREYLHGSLVKNIEISYEKNGLPREIFLNRKKFIFYSTFN